MTIENRNDKEYSRVCSFSKICDYMKNDKPKEYKISKNNYNDTYQLRYNTFTIEIYKKRIHNLYLKSICYKLDSLSIKKILPVISNCDIAICNDSSFSHLSAALGIKTIVLMTDTPLMYGSYSKHMSTIIPE